MKFLLCVCCGVEVALYQLSYAPEKCCIINKHRGLCQVLQSGYGLIKTPVLPILYQFYTKTLKTS